MGDASVLEILKDLVLIAAAGVGMYVGLRGLRTWRLQITGATRHEVARRIMRALRSFKDSIEGTQLTIEGVDAIRAGQGTLWKSAKLRTDPAGMERAAIERFRQAEAALRTAADEAVDLFGPEASSRLGAVFTLSVGFHLSLVVRENRDANTPPGDTDAERRLSWSPGEGFSKNLRDAVDAAVEYFRGHV